MVVQQNRKTIYVRQITAHITAIRPPQTVRCTCVCMSVLAHWTCDHFAQLALCASKVNGSFLCYSISIECPATERNRLHVFVSNEIVLFGVFCCTLAHFDMLFQVNQTNEFCLLQFQYNWNIHADLMTNYYFRITALHLILLFKLFFCFSFNRLIARSLARLFQLMVFQFQLSLL